jgi:hypothetical protein
MDPAQAAPSTVGRRPKPTQNAPRERPVSNFRLSRRSDTWERSLEFAFGPKSRVQGHEHHSGSRFVQVSSPASF